MIFWARPRFEWHLRTRTLALGDRTRIMAVVDLPDSSGPGRGPGPGFHSAAWAKMAVAAAVGALDAGADIVSLGTGSAQAQPAPSAYEEQARLLAVLEGTLTARPSAVVAVNPHHSETALAAALAGAEIVNLPFGGGWDEHLGAAVARTRCGLVLRATFARPRQSVPEGPMSSDEVIPGIFSGLCERLMLAEAAGIDAGRIAADPSLDSGDRGPRGSALLAGLSRLRQLGRPLLWSSDTPRRPHPESSPGIESPEAHDDPEAAIAASQTAAILAGAHLLRVRDVPAARQAALVADELLEAGE